MIQINIRKGTGEKQLFTVADNNMLIGRAENSDVILRDSNVSRVHAVIKKINGAYTIKDMGSSNGVYLEGQLIPAKTEVQFSSNQFIMLGGYLINVLSSEDVDTSDSTHFSINTRKEQVEPKDEKPVTPEVYKNPDFVLLKKKIHVELLELIDLRRLDLKGVTDEDLRKRCKGIVEGILQKRRYSLPNGVIQDALVKDILDEALGLGPLEDLLDDPDVSEIMVNSKDKIYIEKNGQITLSPKAFTSNESVLGIIQRIVGPIGRRIDESSPLVDARLEDGSRVNAVIPPLALNGPCITIRKFRKTPFTTENLLQKGSLTTGMVEFIKTCVKYKKNIVVSGGTGSGKTTLLNIFSSFIPSGERLVTIEDAAELQLEHEHLIRLEARPRNIEGKGEISIQDLVKNALRMRPDRIIVGECRGGEALDMLQAMNTGHDGSMTTGHANTPRDMLSRLETMVMMTGKDIPSRAIKEQIAAAVDVIVQQTRFSCGSRVVTEISEIVGIEDGEFITQKIFYFRQDGHDDTGRVKGTFIATGWIPNFIMDLHSLGINISMDIFHNH